MVFEYNDETLAELLANDYSSTEIIKQKNHFTYLKEYFGSTGLNAKTVVVEEKYISKDFLEDFMAYYASCFESYPRYCKRVHFFSESFTQEAFNTALLEEATEAGNVWNNYLGFVVVKPIPSTVIGTTLLKMYPNERNFGNRTFWGTRNYVVHLFGKKLNIESLAFQEQDSVVSACATSAIWSTLHKASYNNYATLKSPHEITSDAGKLMGDGGRIFPNKGLNGYQISQALLSSGLVCEIRSGNVTMEERQTKVVSNTYLKQLINAYSPIGIPLILGVQVPTGDTHGGHAIAVTGYLKDEPKTIEPREEISLLSDNLSKFYAHDDQWGPFTRIEFKGECGLFTPWSRFDKQSKDSFTSLVVIPLYQKVRIAYEDIFALTKGLDSILTEFTEGNITEDFIWDIKLRLSEDYKSRIKEKPNLEDEEKLIIIQTSLPKYIWVAECWVGCNHLFDFVFDATAVKNGMIGLLVVSYIENNFRDTFKKFLVANPLVSEHFLHRNKKGYFDFLIASLS